MVVTLKRLITLACQCFPYHCSLCLDFIAAQVISSHLLRSVSGVFVFWLDLRRNVFMCFFVCMHHWMCALVCGTEGGDTWNGYSPVLSSSSVQWSVLAGRLCYQSLENKAVCTYRRQMGEGGTEGEGGKKDGEFLYDSYIHICHT